MDIIIELESSASPLHTDILMRSLIDERIEGLAKPFILANRPEDNEMSAGEWLPVIITALASAKYVGQFLNCINTYIKAKHSRSIKLKMKKDTQEITIDINNSSNTEEILKLISDLFEKGDKK